jgi:hypothetical protein
MRTVFGGAIEAQESSASFKGRLTRVENHVRGAMGKDRGRLIVLPRPSAATERRRVDADMLASYGYVGRGG